MSTVSDFYVGMFIQSSDAYMEMMSPTGGKEFIGSVTGVSVNDQGEPVLLVSMITRKFTDHMSMLELGYTPADDDGDHDLFYQRNAKMHPENVTALHPDTILSFPK